MMRSIKSFLNEGRYKMPKLEVVYPDRVRIDLKGWKGGPDGGKSVGLGKETSISPHETFQMATENLYHELATQHRLLWERGPGEAPREAAQVVGDEEIDEPPAPVDPSWCPTHKLKMTRREKGGEAWYSHKVGQQWCSGHWCVAHGCQLYKNEKDGSVWYSHAMQDPDTGETVWCHGQGESALENESPEDAAPVEYMEEEIPF